MLLCTCKLPVSVIIMAGYTVVMFGWLKVLSAKVVNNCIHVVLGFLTTIPKF